MACNRKPWSVLLITLWLLGHFTPIKAQESGLRILEEMVNRFRVDHPEATLAVGLLEGDRSAVRFFGTIAGSHRPDSSTRYRLGRVTSLWTTAVAVALMRDGLFALDAPVSEYLPVNVPTPVYQRLVCQPVQRAEQSPRSEDPRFTPYVCLPDPSDKPQPILLCYLATHTSGLPDQPFTLERKSGVPDYGGFTAGSLYKFLSLYRLEQPIGFDYAYSDLGIVLLAHAIQRKSGTSIDTLFQQLIARPLEMTASRFQSGSVPGGMGLYAPAIGGDASFSDLICFLRANIDPSGEVGKVLEYMHAPRVRIREREEVALGWRCRTFEGNGRRVLYMSGSEAGQTVVLAFDEAGKSGFVLAGDSSGIELLGDQLINSLYSKPE